MLNLPAPVDASSSVTCCLRDRQRTRSAAAERGCRDRRRRRQAGHRAHPAGRRHRGEGGAAAACSPSCPTSGSAGRVRGRSSTASDARGLRNPLEPGGVSRGKRERQARGADQSAGSTTSPVPPPRRTGSATAVMSPPSSTSMAATAPISAVEREARDRRRVSAPLYAVQERRLGRDGGRVPLRCTRCGDRLGQGHPEVDPVHQHLRHGGDDHRPAGRADDEADVAVIEHDRRRHRRPRALARPEECSDLVGIRIRVRGSEVEVGELVVQQEAAARHGHARAAGLIRS